jgi:hypothetical protein
VCEHHPQQLQLWQLLQLWRQEQLCLSHMHQLLTLTLLLALPQALADGCFSQLLVLLRILLWHHFLCLVRYQQSTWQSLEWTSVGAFHCQTSCDHFQCQLCQALRHGQNVVCSNPLWAYCSHCLLLLSGHHSLDHAHHPCALLNPEQSPSAPRDASPAAVELPHVLEGWDTPHIPWPNQKVDVCLGQAPLGQQH